MSDLDALESLNAGAHPTMLHHPEVYDLFIEEVDALTIRADMPAVAVVGELTRAVKRAQLTWNGVIARVADRKPR